MPRAFLMSMVDGPIPRAKHKSFHTGTLQLHFNASLCETIYSRIQSPCCDVIPEIIAIKVYLVFQTQCSLAFIVCVFIQYFHLAHLHKHTLPTSLEEIAIVLIYQRFRQLIAVFGSKRATISSNNTFLKNAKGVLEEYGGWPHLQCET